MTYDYIERALLGAILQRGSLITAVRHMLDIGDLHDPQHRTVYRAICALDDQGITPDLVTVGQHLLAGGDLDSVGPSYLSGLCDGIPATDDVSGYIRMVRALSADRRIRHELQEAVNRIEDDGESPRDVAESLLARLIERAQPDHTATSLIRIGDAVLLPAPTYILDTHLVERGLNVLFGPSGSYKTFWALSESLYISLRRPVVYEAAEAASGLGIRAQSWADHCGSRLGDLHIYADAVDLLSTAALERFIKLIEASVPNCALVVFDTLARSLLGGDENSAKDVGLAISNLNLIQRRLNCAVLVIHHSNRAERGERGSGALRGAADCMIEMSVDDGLITLECSKLKDGAPWPAERFRFVQVGDSGVLVAADQVAEPINLSDQARKILETLALSIFDQRGARLTQIEEGTGIKQRTLYRLLSRLKTANLVWQSDKGDPYFITAEGRKLVPTANGVSFENIGAPPVLTASVTQ